MTKLLMAVDQLHKEGIYHRDLKPQNILVLGTEAPTICITDFGLAASSSNVAQLSYKCGTPNYIDPSVLNGEIYNQYSDIFSLGSIFFNLLTRRFLFLGNTAQQMLHSNEICDPIIRAREVLSSHQPSIPQYLSDMVLQMIQKNRSKRPNI